MPICVCFQTGQGLCISDWVLCYPLLSSSVSTNTFLIRIIIFTNSPIHSLKYLTFKYWSIVFGIRFSATAPFCEGASHIMVRQRVGWVHVTVVLEYDIIASNGGVCLLVALKSYCMNCISSYGRFQSAFLDCILHVYISSICMQCLLFYVLLYD